ncbi:MAG: cysteine desulfurase [Clostridia bacterium]|nr:cysteine desulfurase [Clostridia bacterium]
MIYFDNSATTKPYKEVVELVSRLMLEEFGNSSSLHVLGIRAERILENSRKSLAESIKAQPDEIVFTSGGTESVNMAIKGGCEAMKRTGKHILTSPVEHDAALESLKLLQGMGFELEIISVDEFGRIDLEDLERKLRKDTIFVNIMAVNNELGTIEPVTEAAQIIKQTNPAALFHVDAVQAYGKLSINVKSLKADLISFSSHKVHGPKGVGMLYVRQGTRLHPILSGGGHERKLRSGTVNVPGIAGFSLAVSLKMQRMAEDQARCQKVRERLLSELDSRLGLRLRVNSPEDGIANILNISLEGVKAEVLLHLLEMKEIYISSGSACHSKRDTTSHVLKAVGIPPVWAEGALRFSFCGDNTEEEAESCAMALEEAYNTLKR